VPTPVEHIAVRRGKEVAKSSRASASWTLHLSKDGFSSPQTAPLRRAALSDQIAS
jgi:hypothetical protein